jgi:hypothetical protein
MAGFQPSVEILEISNSFLGVPSGLDASHRISPGTSSSIILPVAED